MAGNGRIPAAFMLGSSYRRGDLHAGLVIPLLAVANTNWRYALMQVRICCTSPLTIPVWMIKDFFWPDHQRNAIWT